MEASRNLFPQFLINISVVVYNKHCTDILALQFPKEHPWLTKRALSLHAHPEPGHVQPLSGISSLQEWEIFGFRPAGVGQLLPVRMHTKLN